MGDFKGKVPGKPLLIITSAKAVRGRTFRQLGSFRLGVGS